MTKHSALSSIVPDDLRRRAVLLVALCVVVGAAGAPGVVAAQEDDEPEQLPAAYYGSVTIDGEAAPAGVEVTALVDGSVADSVTTDADGSFGGPTADDEKLVVHAESGDEVRFEVDADDVQGATDTVAWDSGANAEVELAGESDDGDDDGGVTIRPPSSGSADIVVDGLELVEGTVTVGEQAVLDTTIANEGDGSGVIDAEVRLDDEVVHDDRIVVGADSEREKQYELDTAGLSTGEYEVTLQADEETADASLTVEESSGSSDDADGPDEAPDDDQDDEDDGSTDDTGHEGDGSDDDTIPGFGLVAALFALAAVGALGRHRDG